MKSRPTLYGQPFFDANADAEMSQLRSEFLAQLPPGASVLDAGCSAGWDTAAFTAHGCKVTAFDASSEMVRLARPARAFSSITRRSWTVAWEEAFDGIWAYASLLHVPAAELHDAFERLACALADGGALYGSLRYGVGEVEREGRWFTNLDELGLADLLRQVPQLSLTRQWTTDDVVRTGRTSGSTFSAKRSGAADAHRRGENQSSGPLAGSGTGSTLRPSAPVGR